MAPENTIGQPPGSAPQRDALARRVDGPALDQYGDAGSGQGDLAVVKAHKQLPVLREALAALQGQNDVNTALAPAAGAA